MNKEYVVKNIDELPMDIREAVCLYYIDDISTNEIAKRLNLSTSTIRSRISKGMYLLKKKMNDKALMEAHFIIYSKVIIDRKKNLR